MRHRSNLHRSHGFTLIEAAIALVIVSLLAGIAIPAYGNAVAASHAGKARVDLAATVFTGLRHALVTEAKVVVCASSDGMNCNGSVDWSDGWIAFADVDDNRLHGANETLLSHHEPLAGSVHLRSTSGRTRIVLQPRGGAAAGSNVTFTLCDSRGPAKATALVLANSGQLRQGVPSQAATQACAGPA